MFNLFNLFQWSSLAPHVSLQERCTSLSSAFHYGRGLASIQASYITAGSTFPVPGSCTGEVSNPVDICRVYAIVNTSESSAVRFEAWLPIEWHGRLLGIGNAGLGGCIDYSDLQYGSSLHFATIGSDNGHDGNHGSSFLNAPEVIKDFSYRSVHTEAELGKALVKAYYGIPHQKSYYLGCSTGGRQGMRMAMDFPGDFDGILAGAPATNFNALQYASGMYSVYSRLLTAESWGIITKEILRQCDGLDGMHDGIIAEPRECTFRPEALLCASKTGTECLTRTEVEALRALYAPVHGSQGELIYPGLDPGSEANLMVHFVYGQGFFPYALDYLRNAVYNDSSWEPTEFGLDVWAKMVKVDPAGMSTCKGDLSKFRNMGGKLLMYHGRRDALIPSGASIQLYDSISSTMSLSSLDDFLRLFLIPGMDHCNGGVGAPEFGQKGFSSNIVNASSHNALLALVEWVEGSTPPDVIIGSNPADLSTRSHCRYPQRSVWKDSSWVCVEVM